MIQIYSKENTKYDMNGDMTLSPKSCIAEAELNGTWKMEMVHPRDQEGRWRYIEEECVISAPTFMGDRQLFRISEVEKTDDEVTVTALPIFLDSGDDHFLMDVRPTAKNGQEALDLMMSGSPYRGESNITAAATAYFVERNLPDAINGTEEPTFISRWGGEILYDNYKVIINERVGGDYGVEVRYGKNLEGIDHTLDMSGVVTRIIPVAYNGYKMSGSTPWADSPNINKYEKKYIRKIKFDDVKMREDAQEDDEENGIAVCDTQEELNAALTARCKKAFDSGLDLPAVSIEVRMAELAGTEEYKDVKILEKVGLGDDIRCRHKELDITTKERVVKIAWDCCRNRVEKLTLGKSTYDYFSNTNASLDSIDSILNSIGGTIGDDGSVMAGKIKGFIDATKAQLRLQNGVAKKQIVRAFQLEDLDPDSELYGAMALGTLGLQIAKRRTADNRDWDWTTALTANGLVANIIVAGILSDKLGLNYWNLDTGEFSLSATGFKIDGKKASEYIKEDWTQEEVFNKLTRNGQDMGICLIDGKLYINANFINAGTISASLIKGGTMVLGGPNNVYGTISFVDSVKVIDENGVAREQVLLKIGGRGMYFTRYTTSSGNPKYYKIEIEYGNGGIRVYRTDSWDDNAQRRVIGSILMDANGITLNNAYVEGFIKYSEEQEISLGSWGSNSLSFKYNIRLQYLTSNGDISGTYIRYLGAWDAKFSGLSVMDLDVYKPATFWSDVDVKGSLSVGSLGRNTNENWVTASSSGKLQCVSPSSIRYKEIDRSMTENDISQLYRIQPVIAKYREGVLKEDDERYGIAYPMFIAEDIEKYYPVCVRHDEHGNTEDWNSRIMIPAMFQMLKSQKETIDNQRKEIENLTERIERIERLKDLAKKDVII